MMGYQAISTDAFKCGHTLKGGDIYLGRAFYNKEWVPAKLIPSREKIYICHRRKEIELAGITRIQKLIGDPNDYKWFKYDGDSTTFPIDAVPVDQHSHKYFIGRKRHLDTIGPGKIEEYVLFFGYEGKRLAFLENYEVLCYGNKLVTEWHDLSFVSYTFP